jgi:hypothetical protein
MNGALLSSSCSLCFFYLNFDIRARLVLCVSTEEEGEIQSHDFVCPVEETMSQCGVDGNSKLFVKVEQDPDDEEDEEDEEV